MKDKLKKEIFEEFDERFNNKDLKQVEPNFLRDDIKSFLNYTIDRIRKEEEQKWAERLAKAEARSFKAGRKIEDIFIDENILLQVQDKKISCGRAIELLRENIKEQLKNL